MARKLYMVELTVEALVVVEDEKEAMTVGWNAVREEFDNYMFHDILVIENPKTVPRDWDETCLVYHKGEEEITVKQAREFPTTEE